MKQAAHPLRHFALVAALATTALTTSALTAPALAQDAATLDEPGLAE